MAVEARRTADRLPVADAVAPLVEARLEVLLEAEQDRWADVDPDLGAPVATLLEHVRSGGKRLRPTFCHIAFTGAGGVAGDPVAVDAGAALELLHAFALLHDDVMDDAASRRGVATAHISWEGRHRDGGWRGEARRFGEGVAVLVGDLAAVYADRLLGEAPAPARRLYDDLRVELMAGQFLDLLHTARGGVRPTVARRIAVLKSARYTVERPLQLGAALAGRLDDLGDALSAYGLPLGEAFQLRDDLLGAFGDPFATGKPVGDDLREGKPTLLLALAVEPGQRHTGRGARAGRHRRPGRRRRRRRAGRPGRHRCPGGRGGAGGDAHGRGRRRRRPARPDGRGPRRPRPAGRAPGLARPLAMDVVVVGAGLGGLAAACHLVGSGHDVVVVERGPGPGGRAGRIEREGYAFDTGPTVLTMPDLLTATFAAAGADMADHLTLSPVDPMYRAVYPDGSVLRVRHGREAMAEEIRTVCGPAEAASFHRFVDWLTSLYELEMPSFIDRNFDSPLDLARPPGPALRLLLAGGLGKLGKRVARFFDDERLQRLFSFQSLYAGLAPHEALAIYSVITYMDSVAGVFTAEGGIHAVPTGLAAAAAEAGVDVPLVRTGGAHPARGGHDRPGARGAARAAASVLRADAVVCNPDLPVAYRTLLGGPAGAPGRPAGHVLAVVRGVARRRAGRPARGRRPPQHPLRRPVGRRPSGPSSTRAVGCRTRRCW